MTDDAMIAAALLLGCFVLGSFFPINFRGRPKVVRAIFTGWIIFTLFFCILSIGLLVFLEVADTARTYEHEMYHIEKYYNLHGTIHVVKMDGKYVDIRSLTVLEPHDGHYLYVTRKSEKSMGIMFGRDNNPTYLIMSPEQARNAPVDDGP